MIPRVFALLLLVSNVCLANDRQAERFVSIALSLGREHPEAIDGYFGPQRLDARTAKTGPTWRALRSDARALLTDIESSPDKSPRRQNLLRQVRALNGLLEVIDKPGTRSFEAEAKLVYGTSVPAP